MNSLEFINIEIAKIKRDYKKHIRFRQTNFAIADEKHLKHLQQIKAELEAWYEIKDLYKKGYFSRIALPTESHEKFKKAVEVEGVK